jgi:maleylacetate reductase
MIERFRHVDPSRTIVFGPDAISDALDLLGEGYTLLTTPRAAAAVPVVAERAARVVHVPQGQVPPVAAGVRPDVTGARLVALGGGRVIDVAKALAAADPPREVVAIPTSLSGAEMTGVHRHAEGVAEDTPRVRAAVVINDPGLSASQPVAALAASSANALGHATTARFSVRSSPIARAVGEEAMQHLVAGWSMGEPDRAAIALGALLAGWAVDQSGLGLHHALAQSAVRTASLGHAETNAALLPATVGATRVRRPAEFERLDARLPIELETVAQELRRRASAGLGVLATDSDLLERAIEAATARPELGRIPPPPDRTEIAAIYRTSAVPDA